MTYCSKHEGPAYNYREFITLTKVMEEWDNGFYIHTYIIDREGIYHEKACWNGKRLNYDNLGKRIKRKKYEAVEKLISECRTELEYLGANNESMDDPDVHASSFFYIQVPKCDDDDYERFSYYYMILSIENEIVTYRNLRVTDNDICLSERIYRRSIEDFLSFPDNTRWYPISYDIYMAATKKIVYMTKQIFSLFGKPEN